MLSNCSSVTCILPCGMYNLARSESLVCNILLYTRSLLTLLLCNCLSHKLCSMPDHPKCNQGSYPQYTICTIGEGEVQFPCLQLVLDMLLQYNNLHLKCRNMEKPHYIRNLPEMYRRWLPKTWIEVNWCHYFWVPWNAVWVITKKTCWNSDRACKWWYRTRQYIWSWTKGPIEEILNWNQNW